MFSKHNGMWNNLQHLQLRVRFFQPALTLFVPIPLNWGFASYLHSTPIGANKAKKFDIVWPKNTVSIWPGFFICFFDQISTLAIFEKTLLHARFKRVCGRPLTGWLIPSDSQNLAQDQTHTWFLSMCLVNQELNLKNMGSYAPPATSLTGAVGSDSWFALLFALALALGGASDEAYVAVKVIGILAHWPLTTINHLYEVMLDYYPLFSGEGSLMVA